jgi:hypothetical protein
MSKERKRRTERNDLAIRVAAIEGGMLVERVRVKARDAFMESAPTASRGALRWACDVLDLPTYGSRDALRGRLLARLERP